VLLLASTLVALAIGEGAIRLLGVVQGVDYGRFLQELTDAERLPRAIWADPRPFTVWRTYPPFRPGARALALTSEFAVPYDVNAQGLRTIGTTSLGDGTGSRTLAPLAPPPW
jgi:hypothetical protein